VKITFFQKRLIFFRHRPTTTIRTKLHYIVFVLLSLLNFVLPINIHLIGYNLIMQIMHDHTHVCYSKNS
jgi:hypothetical protein